LGWRGILSVDILRRAQWCVRKPELSTELQKAGTNLKMGQKDFTV
jgi:hypothetical protein